MPVAWHEAVAAARLLALSAQRQAPPLELPRLSQILIDTDAELLTTGSEPVGHDAIPALGRILGALLNENNAPAELVSLSDDFSSACRDPTL